MELRILILSVACFACLVPSGLSLGILTKAAATKAVVSKGALVAKGVLTAKGAALAKGASFAKGALALKGAAVAKGLTFTKGLAAKGAALAKGGALLAKGALASKGALFAKGVLAVKGLLAAKKALTAKGLMLAKGAAAAVVAKGVAAKTAAVKGAALLAKGAAAKVVATKVAAVKGAVGAAKGFALSKVAAASGAFSKPTLPIPVAPPVGVPALFPVLSPWSAAGRRSYDVQQVAVDPVSGITRRIGQWAGAIHGALVEQSGAASNLVSAMTRRVASASIPVVYEEVETPSFYPFYPVPVTEKVERIIY